jgi:uncharacterized protein YndB with AHSA1/START domain
VTTTTTTTEPITKEIHVDASPETAFAVFTERIGDWWPLERYSVFERETTVAFEGDRIVERSGDKTSVWGEVLAFQVGGRVRFTWHPGREDDDQPTEVEVTFAADGGGTLVTLVHSGWERLSEERLSGRDDYDKGWPLVLERYAALAK